MSLNALRSNLAFAAAAVVGAAVALVSDGAGLATWVAGWSWG